MLRCKEWQHSQCPRCFRPNEDALHILTCPACSARYHWNKLMCAYWAQLKWAHTSPDLISLLQAVLPRVPSLSFPAFSSSSASPATALLASQHTMGWLCLLFGRQSSHWHSVQDRWLVSRIATRWKKYLLLWASQFIRFTMDLTWGIWEQRNECLHLPSHLWILAQEAPFDISRHKELYHTLSVAALSPTDRWLLSIPLPCLLTEPSPVRRRCFFPALLALKSMSAITCSNII